MLRPMGGREILGAAAGRLGSYEGEAKELYGRMARALQEKQTISSEALQMPARAARLRCSERRRAKG